MIYKETILDVAENSGARLVQCIGIPGSGKKKFSKIGDLVTVVVKSALSNAKVKRGQIYKGVVVRTKYPIIRSGGFVLRFDDNAVVLLDNQGDVIGTSVFGPIPREVRSRNMHIASLAQKVV